MVPLNLKDTTIRINTLDPGWLRTDLGGDYAEHPVEDVLPGALAPALIGNDGPNGKSFFGIGNTVI
jgi:3-oxoacyl-[acyl-carrier protein] reductase